MEHDHSQCDHEHAYWRYRRPPKYANSRRDCPHCLALHNVRCWQEKRRRRQRLADGALPAEFLRHGEYYTYNHYGCHCDLCRAANARQQARYRAG